MKLGAAFAALIVPAVAARGSFELVDNFQEPLGMQTWLGEVVADPTNPANSVSSPSDLGKTLLPTPIANGSVGTIFFRGYWDTSINSMELGAADALSVATSDLTPSQMGTEAFEHSANTFGLFGSTAAQGTSTLSDLSPGVWYNFWVVVDNNAGTSSYYLSSGDQIPTTPLQIGGISAFPEFNTPAGAIQSLAFDPGLYIDDIYEDPAGMDLTDPVPEPTCLASAAGMAGFLLRRRRR